MISAIQKQQQFSRRIFTSKVKAQEYLSYNTYYMKSQIVVYNRYVYEMEEI